MEPSSTPSSLPTNLTSYLPTGSPTGVPSSLPTVSPKGQPTCLPSGLPSCLPSGLPTNLPTEQLTNLPTRLPSDQPTNLPTELPTGLPTNVPTGLPTGLHTNLPTGLPTELPISAPTNLPTGLPTSLPYNQPIGQPTERPTNQLTGLPSELPTGPTTILPIGSATGLPTGQLTGVFNSIPSEAPVIAPLVTLTISPSGVPCLLSSSKPSLNPTGTFPYTPTSTPSIDTSQVSTSLPIYSTSSPTLASELLPTAVMTSDPPSYNPTDTLLNTTPEATRSPTEHPLCTPTMQPTRCPTNTPTIEPTTNPTRTPTSQPVVRVPTSPTARPTLIPTLLPRYFSTLKAYGGPRADYVTAIAISASDWGSVLAGYDIGCSAAEYDGYIMKLNKCGEIVWTKAYGGPLVDSINDVAMSQDGTIVFLGDWTPPNSFHSEIMLGRVNPLNGELIRVMSYSVVGAGTLRGCDLVLNDDGSVLIVGAATTSSRSRALVLLVDVDNNVAWRNALGGNVAGRSYVYSEGTRLTSGDYVLVGHGLVDDKLTAVVSRLHADGEHKRSSQWGIRGFDQANSIARNRDGGYVLAATSRDFSDTNSVSVLRFDSRDRLMWAVSIGGSGVGVPSKIIVTHDDGFLLVGSTTSYGTGAGTDHRIGWVVKLNGTGQVEWAKRYGSGGYYKDYLYDVVELPGGGYRAVGNGLSNRASASMDAFLAQITPDGHLGDDSFMIDLTSVLRARPVDIILADVPTPTRYVDGIGADVTSSLKVTTIPRHRKAFVQSPCHPSTYVYSAWPTEVPSATEITSPPSIAVITTLTPSVDPTSSQPTSSSPTTSIPSYEPTTTVPTSSMPSMAPSAPSTKPTPVPSILPGNPTPHPTSKPTSRPSHSPTHRPTGHPTVAPSAKPTAPPTLPPTAKPTAHPPPRNPSTAPSLPPSRRPTRDPTASPTHSPSFSPSVSPTTSSPSRAEISPPAAWPSSEPTSAPVGDSIRRSSGIEDPNQVGSAIILTTLVIIVVFGARSCARWYMDDPYYSYADMCIAVVAALSSTRPASTKEKNNIISAPHHIIAKEYMDPESGLREMIYFVQVGGWHATCSSGEIDQRRDVWRLTEKETDDACVESSHGGGKGDGGAQEIVARVVGQDQRSDDTSGDRGAEEARQQGDSSDDKGLIPDSDSNTSNDINDDDSSSDDLRDSEESGPVGGCDASRKAGRNVFAMESDDSDSSEEHSGFINKATEDSDEDESDTGVCRDVFEVSSSSGND